MNINGTIDRLIEKIEQKSTQEIPAYGLWKGKAGLAILFTLLSDATGKDSHSEKAQELLNEIIDHIATVQQLSYADGILGIGWAIEWLTQQGYLDIDTDEALADIDDILYNTVVYSSDKLTSLGHGTLGKTNYLAARIKSANPSYDHYRATFQKEGLVVLTNDLYEQLVGENGLVMNGLYNKTKDNIIDIADAIVFLSKFMSESVNEARVEDILYLLIEKTNDLFTLMAKPGYLSTLPVAQHWPELKYLAFACYLAGKNYQQGVWRKEALGHLAYLEDHTPVLNELSNDNKFRLLKIYSLMQTEMPSENNTLQFAGILQSIDIDQLDLSLKNGLGELWILSMTISNPTFLSDPCALVI